ncbi:MAG: DUF4442 domain-containing protein [Bacteroidota bacterium]|nr:DUF4442 domain-containing protein [Bacteroidota bacterium]
MKTTIETKKREDFNSKIKKFKFNFFPAYRRTGGRIIFISSDWQEVHVKLELNRRTRNYVGTAFGGSIFGALDPIYMVQLINLLGKEYIVWDKSAKIKFIKPIKKTVYAKFIISNELLSEIKEQIKISNKYIIDLDVSFYDEEKIIYAKTTKKIFIANKSYIKNKALQ